ncbi:hypothetical protein WL05_07690 [Burkholderia ubonensis]|uniref:DUF4148 domain-containing protein n=1 Tax=Burkholderia ubonensis TaxID=101571 RepID=A0ABD4E4H1_9BURK|nr:DUF4148 domain-containing protein [Burkholderia ubonensis]KVH67337.1 hypothetical protein WJ41_23660 [Burkholderia ubonensis]KVM05535.1 hypothetical protein WJ51_26490 [Burkholderia ubonensis]KVM09679.1 hypothetical protein WJ52_23790 [Burkholderia ubonensis]KVM53134.1 hypothetical protein WJ56_09065 [Burkholderia ubonensis]KVN86635.1 hypothetical protein WJ68_10965 [Burkholderia ubonensis]
MKHPIGLLIVAALIAGDAASAQTPAPLTRAQVLEELYQLEAAGYDPSAGDQGTYPADIQAAEAKVAAQRAARAAAAGANAPSAGLPAQAGR